MNFQEFRKYNVARNKVWDSEGVLDIEFKALELAGEVGEFCNFIKKYMRYLKGIQGGKSMSDILGPARKELADIFICLDLAADSLGINLEEAVKEKFNETSRKYDLPLIP